MDVSSPRRPRIMRHPAQVVALAFAAVVVVGTSLLWLPVARRGPGAATFVEALFTAVSALCVTGHVVVDTREHWSNFGLVVILALAQVGGFGIMTSASLLGVFASRRLGLRSRMLTATESRGLDLGDVRTVLLGVVRVSVVVELVTAVALSSRLLAGYDRPLTSALWEGTFLAVSSFNNAGFVLRGNSMTDFVSDPWMCLPVVAASLLGGLGFPVLLELRRQFRVPRRWSLHTRLTLATTIPLLLVGWVFLTLNEWSNPATLARLDWWARPLAGLFQAAATRSSGFNSIDITQMNGGSWLVMDVLMFIGGGSASTAGGIKVTTFALLAVALYAEFRGEPTVSVFGRRVPDRVVRQALTVALVSVAAVVVATIVLVEMTRAPLDMVVFEVISAFATVGLSSGLLVQLPESGQVILAFLMFLGRLGPITLGAALALRERTRMYEYPEGRPIIG
ncbi:potassium uptake TrkH family protein [Kineococcus radiotolerans]|uniref:H(+)-transporting two-sector ATPase n=2 Tax=Kineococcus radiotolerans TaxID=131568 RepID=A6WFX0_KINRD|nr:potassium transporter TrkG [Kineococcus radiotolerans]ABS05709.1 H(+)-transporting two-sector ATPase [Kineococcus radiotolerans SRS30216 = ATCC BAA-149]MBB2902593.1 potassium uptake TrkH family protein [Kineococcus radiotolerans]